MSFSEDDFLDELKKDFLNEITFDLDQAEESYMKLENPELRRDELAKIFRLAHSLKGTGAAVGYLDLAGFAHVVEDYLAILRVNTDLVDEDAISVLLKVGDAFRTRIEMFKQGDSSPWNIEDLKQKVQNLVKELSKVPTYPGIKSDIPKAEEQEPFFPIDLKTKEDPSVESSNPQTGANVSNIPKPKLLAVPNKNQEGSLVKIEAQRVDTVLDLVGELVVAKSQLLNHIDHEATDGKLSSIASLMDKIIRELQDRTLAMRMTPLKQLFLKTQRIVRDISLKLHKDVHLEMSGEDTEIDRTLVEMLSDPLMHMIRNAMDHGIESSEVRKAKGKDEKGHIKMMASQEGGRVILRIQDDGGGIDRNKILAKAIKNNLISPNTDTTKLSDRQVFEFLCLPGFSTAEKVTDLSGRGVGLDVVRSNIEKMRGTLLIQSTVDVGTTFVVSLPLTTSITDGILITVGTGTFVLPIGSVKEILPLELKSVTKLSSGDLVLRHREDLYPMVHLGCLLNKNLDMILTNKDLMVVLIESSTSIIALVVEKVIGQTQVVLKSLGETFQTDKGIVGGAIMGDGRVALVLDPIGLREYFEERKNLINNDFLGMAS